MAKVKARPRGRRKTAAEDLVTKHQKRIKALAEKRDKLRDEGQKADVALAVAIDEAQREGVQTMSIGNWLGVSRQMVYKMVREKVDGILLNPPPSKNGDGKKKPAAKKTAKKAPAKPKAKTKKATKNPVKKAKPKKAKAAS